MRAFVRIVVTVALFATTSAQQQASIHLSLEGRLMESGLRFSPSGETRYRVSDYMQQLWMASGAQTLATRGEATACSTVDWTEESARFECPLGQDDYTFAFTYDARDGASVLRVHNVDTGARVDPVQLESLVWELPGAKDQEALNRAEIADITTTVDVTSVFPDGTSHSRQASGKRDSVNDAIMYAAQTVSRLVLDSRRGAGTVEVALTYRIELKDGAVFEHNYTIQPAADPASLFGDPWMSHVLEVRWTLTSQYEARELRATQVARRMSGPSGSRSRGGR